MISEDVIEFANAPQSMEIIEMTSQQVSGLTAAEAEAALNAEVASNGFRLVGETVQSGGNAVIDFPTATEASEAFEAFESSGGLVADSGAAVTGAGGIGVGSVAIASSSGATATVGVAAGSAGMVAAAAAPVFGVALGVGLYELAPEFWTEISQALLPWFYEDTDVMPIVYDGDGNTFISQEALNALGILLSSTGGYVLEEYQPQSSLWALSAQATTYDMLPHTFIYLPANTEFSFAENASHEIRSLVSSVDCIIGFQYTVDRYIYHDYIMIPVTPMNSIPSADTFKVKTGDSLSNMPIVYESIGNQTYYYGKRSAAMGSNWVSIIDVDTLKNNYQPTDYSSFDSDMVRMWYNQVITPQSPLPDAVVQWEGNPYPSNPNTIDVLTGYDENDNPVYERFQQVALPIGDPLVTNDPLIQPDPYYNPLPEVDPQTGAKIYPAIDPYISPIASPNQWPDVEEIPTPSEEQRTAPLPSNEMVPKVVPVPEPSVDPATQTSDIPINQAEPAEPLNNGTSNMPSLPLVPLIPTSGAASLFHVYNPTVAQMDAFGSWLWQSFLGVLFDDISRLFNNPMDAVIGLQEFYGTPNISGSGTIRCGYLDSEVPSNIVGNRYTSINCGSIVVPEFYGNYLDYSPYSQVIIYLPFIGFMTLNADDIIGNAVTVTYHLDSWTGSCIAIITVARNNYESVVYQFEGNCSVEIPLTGGQQSALKGAIIGGISGAVMGGLPGAAVGAIMGGLSTKNDVQHSGAFSASYGAMGAKIPFIVVRRPVQKKVFNYSKSYGYPAHKMVYVGNCQGYLRVREVRVFSTTATNEEKTMIVNALKSGVYVR